MTGTQAPPAEAALPVAPPAAAPRSYRRPYGGASGRRLAHFPLVWRAGLLLGGAAALLAMTVAPAVANSISSHGAATGVSFSPILGAGDIVTGVRGTTGGNVILTGAAATGSRAQAGPFLYQGPLTSAADGAPVSVLTPPFPGVTTATFYGPNTNSFNPDTIPAGQVRAVGSYQSSASPPGVINRGMIYLGPVGGPGGHWTSIRVPAHGERTVGHVRACPQGQPGCFVMDTIAHSTMGDLVVGNYDLNPGHGVSGNAFIQHVRSPVDAAAPGRQPGQRDHAVRHLARRRARQPELHPGQRLLRPRSLAKGKHAGLPDELQRTNGGLREAAVL